MDNIDTILSHIRIQAEAQELLTKLDAFGTTLYSTQTKSIENYFSHLPKPITDALHETFDNLLSTSNNTEAHHLISQLQDKMHALRILQLTIAFDPDDTTLTVFSSWAKNNIGNDVVLDIQINKTLVGGAIIVLDGQYRDYSVHKKLSQVFQIQKEEILGSLSQ